jgi:small-conductance mechanosensitive channel
MRYVYFWMFMLLILNFGAQAYNFMTWQNNPCGYYKFNPDCMVLSNFLLNKLVRFILNLALIWLIQKQLYPQEKKYIWPLFACLLILAFTALYFTTNTSFFAQRSYPVLHPVVFSPLLGIILLAVSFIKPKTPH